MTEESAGVLYRGSGILNIEGDRAAVIIEPLPNTNLINPRTVIPTLIGRLEPGEHKLVCVVLGMPFPEEATRIWSLRPEFNTG